MNFPQSIPMLMDDVLQRVEDEVTAVSLRHQFGFLSSERIREIYLSLLLEVYAEYVAALREHVVDPVIIVAIRRQDVDTGFKKPPQIFHVSLDKAYDLFERMRPDLRDERWARTMAPGMFRVIVVMDFDQKFHALQIPVPPEGG